MKNIKIIFITLLALIVPLSVDFSADELVPRDTIPNADDYQIQESVESNTEDYKERVAELHEQTQKDLSESPKTKSDVVNPNNIFDLIDIANVTLTKDACTNISADFTCKYEANYDGKGTNRLTFKYSANNNFQIITKTNSKDQHIFTARYLSGVRKYDIYFDPNTGEIIKTASYVNGVPQLTTTFENGEAVLFEYLVDYFGSGEIDEYYRFDSDGYLLFHILYYTWPNQVLCETEYEYYYDDYNEDINTRWLKQTCYYENGNLYYEYFFEEEELVREKMYNEKGILVSDIEYSIWGDVLNAKKYYENGIIKTHEKFDEEQNPIMSKAYSQTGKIRNYYTYYSNRQVKTEILYDSRGEQAYRKDNYSNGTRKMIAKYDSGVATERNYYNKSGKRTSQKQYYADGKVSQTSSYDQNGKIELKKAYKSNGKLSSKTYYSNGKKTQVKQYHTNGKTKSILKYDSKERKTTLVTYDTKGQRTSLVEYNKDGTRKKLITYKDGKVVTVKYY